MAWAHGCTVPAPEADLTLGESEMELGVGIHGEPGRHRVPTRPAEARRGRAVGAILHELPARGASRCCSS